MLYKPNLAFFSQSPLPIQNQFAFTVKIFFIFYEVKTPYFNIIYESFIIQEFKGETRILPHANLCVKLCHECIWTSINCVTEALCHRVYGIVHACRSQGGGCLWMWDMRVQHMSGNTRMALTSLDFLFWFGDIHKTTWTCDSIVYTGT